LGGAGTFGVVACVQEVAVRPGELLADADLIHYTMGASGKDEEQDRFEPFIRSGSQDGAMQSE
jgi:hypothetical protein